MNKETFEKKLAAEIESKRKPTPKINDKFRFDDGTIGTITGVECYKDTVPAIVIESRKFGHIRFTIADITLWQASGPVTSNAIWTVKG